ncbi:GNAT family N-acetyltransferase [Lentzea cavernae]|uniref:GNAT family acetyltransferase n=1 Tax=Lentzea cavernae TaxID=2020703 RepID=A0ABQ3MFR9_9PSEU|nr:GNAT family N-acetyltransferase [Lentzea cavernae]GHH40190.1 GNAT family acetyltransferase [Lentzea cavernae]
MTVTRAEAVLTAKAELDFAAAARIFAGAELRRIGGAVVSRVPALPNHVPYNKARGFTLADAVHLPAVEAFYAEAGVRAAVEVWEGDSSDDLHGLLRSAGLAPTAPTAALHRRPGGDGLGAVQVDEVAGEHLDVLLAGYEVGPDATAFRTMLAIEQATPGLRRYLAFVDGRPAAAAALFTHGGTSLLAGAATVPEFRRRGCQAALVARRLADAAADSDLVVVTAASGSVSHKNLTRLGFEMTHTRTVWR